ncbi:MAG: glycosyl transferase [Sphingomonadales bacterium 32-68-7]|nr:MAG: glycosyl transferase [Sphingomonadales bacterium 12-68-11]OYX10596.1 MAG: glycosyl transferase [Sphingomonadales bacterium 32-68-7]
MPKLIIQVPCYNEEATIGETLGCLPRTLPGIGTIEWLVINDGSQDGTVAAARAAGVDHVLDLPVNQGLAGAFMAGLERCLELGADIIVNTDADNQYPAQDIPLLLAPILARRAQFVIGDRPIRNVEHFSWLKRQLQGLGSKVVRFASRTQVGDAPSGFRALSREAAMRIHIFDGYTYTLESIIQAGQSGIRIVSVPISDARETRPSRLMRSTSNYVMRSMATILRTFLVYRPGRSFFLLGLPPAVIGALLMLRWLALYLAGTDRAHVPSLIAAAVLLIMAFLLWLMGLIGELLAINRRLLQDIQYELRRGRSAVQPKDRP